MWQCSSLTAVFLLIIAIIDSTSAGTNCTAADATRNCIDGMAIPIWRPFLDLSTGDRVGRGIIYFFIIAYFFLGVSIVADRFMASIEVITSMERTITVKRPGLEPIKVTVRIWNDTVSNLTLMALGSSAPEILLSIIEVMGKGFEAGIVLYNFYYCGCTITFAYSLWSIFLPKNFYTLVSFVQISGDLGPNTIVGSAAFNLFMIIAICVSAVPSPQVRRQKHLDVFFVTATWSVFAYIWLYVILSVTSPGIIEVWEGLLTFLFFPLTVFTAWVTDIKIIQSRFLPRRYRQTSRGLIATEGEQEMKPLDGNDIGTQAYKLIPQGIVDPALRAFEEHRREFIETMREIRKKNPHIEPLELQKQAEYEMISKGPKSRAFYRVQATRRLIGGGDIVRRKIEKEHHKSLEALINAQDKQARENTARIFFDPAHYTVLENVGTFDVVVGRDGGPEGLTVMVDYFTEDGTANAGSDFIPVKGTLTFYPEDRYQKINIEIVDDDVFEEDEHFYLHLTNLRVRTRDGLILDPSKIGGVPVAALEMPATATVMILDDDHAGIFSFEHDHFQVVESCGHLSLKVQRHSGARGRVIIPYRTVDGSAIGDRDYEQKEAAELVFEDNQTEAFIDIGVIDTEQYERTEHFFIELGDPIWSKKMSDLSKVQERFIKRMTRKRTGSLTLHEGRSDSESSLTVPDRMRKRVGSWIGIVRGDETEEAAAAAARALTEEQLMIAQMGKPRLGEHKKCQVTIKESKEFQGVVDRMLKTANTSIMLGTSTWREQFIEALTVSGDDDDDNGGDELVVDEEGSAAGVAKKESVASTSGGSAKSAPTWVDYIMHFIAVPWKLLFALIPPTDYIGGWACFTVSIVCIGLLTALIGDLASQFGCWVGLKDAVTAISFVALGTSVPDTFASKVAATHDKYADSSIGNVTGSNGVNVFLGIGIAWSMAAIYHWFHGRSFYVNPGTLAFSVTVFCIEAVICITVIVARRHPMIGGELGGPMKFKVLTSGFFTCLWIFYIAISALESYCVIEGF